MSVNRTIAGLPAFPIGKPWWQGGPTDLADGGGRIRFPRLCSQLFFPRSLFEDGETGMSGPNEGGLSATRIARLDVCQSAQADIPATERDG